MFGDNQNDPQNSDNSSSVSAPWPPDPASTGTSTGAEIGSTPIDDVQPAPATPADDTTSPTVMPPSDDTTTPVVPTATSTAAPSSDLLDIKQQALQHLSPLVDHLDQTPEEKFRTTMMMIQASDNQDMVKDAFEAAKLITDDKTRAQAFLDVINEINYFTQQHPAS